MSIYAKYLDWDETQLLEEMYKVEDSDPQLYKVLFALYQKTQRHNNTIKDLNKEKENIINQYNSELNKLINEKENTINDLKYRYNLELKEKEHIIAQKDMTIHHLRSQLNGISHHEKTLRSGSASERVTALQTCVPPGPFPWPDSYPADAVIQHCWRAIKREPALFGIPDDPNTLTGTENEVVHPLFETLINKLLVALGHADEKKICIRPNMLDSQFKPDVAIVKSGISPSFSDLLVSIDLKTPNFSMTEAMAHALDYFFQMLDIKSDETAKEGYISVGCNLCCIQSIFSNSNSVETCVRSQVLQLFEKGWRNDDCDASDGFALLCRLLSMPVRSPEQVNINDQLVTIQSTIYKGNDTAVYQCPNILSQNNEDSVAIKVGVGEFGIGIVGHFELTKYEMIDSITELHPYMVRLRRELRVKNGYAMSLGEPLPYCVDRWRNEKSDGAQNEVDRRLAFIFKHLCEGLAILHRNKWRHLDIRPLNIVMIGNTPRFIDWATAMRANEDADVSISEIFCHGRRDYFWPSPLSLFEDRYRFPGQSAKWDLLSLCYTIAFLSCEDPERKSFLSDRDGFMKTASSFLGKTRLVSTLGNIIEDIKKMDDAQAPELSAYEQILALV